MLRTTYCGLPFETSFGLNIYSETTYIKMLTRKYQIMMETLSVTKFQIMADRHVYQYWLQSETIVQARVKQSLYKISDFLERQLSQYGVECKWDIIKLQWYWISYPVQFKRNIFPLCQRKVKYSSVRFLYFHVQRRAKL